MAFSDYAGIVSIEPMLLTDIRMSSAQEIDGVDSLLIWSEFNDCQDLEVYQEESLRFNKSASSSVYSGITTTGMNFELGDTVTDIGISVDIPEDYLDLIENFHFRIYETTDKSKYKFYVVPSADLIAGKNTLKFDILNPDSMSNEYNGDTSTVTSNDINAPVLTASYLPTTQMTIEFWLYVDSIPVGLYGFPYHQDVYSAVHAENHYLRCYVFGDAYAVFDPTLVGQLVFSAGSAYNPVSEPYDISARTGEWVHVGLTYDEVDGGQLYIDGASYGSLTGAGKGALYTRATLSDTMRLLFMLVGKITDVRIWNYQRTATDITNDMKKRLLGTEPGLALYWPINEGSGHAYEKVVATDALKLSQTGIADTISWELSFTEGESSFINYVRGADIFLETTAQADELEGIVIDQLSYYVFEDDTLRYSKNTCVVFATGANYMYEGRLLKYGNVTRKLSEKRGLPDIGNMSIEIADNDRSITSKYAAFGGAGGFKGKEVEIKLGVTTNNTAYFDFALTDFLTIYTGIIDNIKFSKLKCNFSIVDNTQRYFKNLPLRLLDPAEWIYLADENDLAPAPIIYGVIDSPSGALPVVYAGTEETNVDYFVIAGHPCKLNTAEFWVDGELQSGGTYSVFEDDETKTVDYEFDYAYKKGDYYYTVLKVDRWNDTGAGEYVSLLDQEDIAINISGKTNDGTSTGTVLTDVMDVIYDLFTKESEIPASVIDMTPWNATKTILQTRNQTIAGAITEDTPFDEIISDICISHNIEFYQTRDGKFAFTTFNPQLADITAPHYSDDINIIKDSFSVNPGIDKLVNRIYYDYSYNYFTGDFEGSNKIQDGTSIDRVGYAIDWDSGRYEMKWVRSPSVATNVSTRILDRYKNGRQQATFNLPLEAYNNELSDKIRITHFDAPTLTLNDTNGWDDHLCRIREMSLDLDKFIIKMTVDNMADLADKCWYFGSSATNASAFSSATDEDKVYGYLCDRTTGKFDDDTDGYKLC